MSEGGARIVGKGSVDMVTEGPCLLGTLDQLEAGVGARPMKREALGKVRADALALLAKVLEAYESGIAQGEVGLRGAAVVLNPATIGSRPPTGLLYGRVQ